VTLAQTATLGALAGFTIFLGLPLGRLQTLSSRTRVALAMFSVGILAFIFVDVLEHGLAILHDSVDALRHDHGSAGRTIGLTALLGTGFLAGSAGLGLLERRMRPGGPAKPPIAGGATVNLEVHEAAALAHELEATRRRALALSLSIAVAIGLHNLAEGLAIGVSARAGAVSLATVLIIGFGLHNATEGFGIVGPLGDVRPSWRWLGAVGLIGGGPTFLGAMIGYAVTSETLELTFYALAGGAILYVIGEVWQGMRRYGHRELGLYLLGLGFMTGVITDLVVTLGGG
jgi:ZIP family zinc transporter